MPCLVLYRQSFQFYHVQFPGLDCYLKKKKSFQMFSLLGRTHYRGKKHGISISHPGMRLTWDHWDDSAVFFPIHTHPCVRTTTSFCLIHHQFPLLLLAHPFASTFLKHPSNSPNFILPSFFIMSFIPRSKLQTVISPSPLPFDVREVATSQLPGSTYALGS